MKTNLNDSRDHLICIFDTQKPCLFFEKHFVEVGFPSLIWTLALFLFACQLGAKDGFLGCQGWSSGALISIVDPYPKCGQWDW